MTDQITFLAADPCCRTGQPNNVQAFQRNVFIHRDLLIGNESYFSFFYLSGHFSDI
jgi:hypothetical protein